jgi:hypothetical protein
VHCDACIADGHTVTLQTLETWMQWQLINGLEDEKFRASAVSFVRFLASELQQTGRQMVLVVVPALPGHFKAPRFEVEHFKALVDRVDYFSVMTYDWQGPEPRSNANAPLRWLMQNLELLLPEGGWRCLVRVLRVPCCAAAADAVLMLMLMLMPEQCVALHARVGWVLVLRVLRVAGCPAEHAS